MRDITTKPTTLRSATATGEIRVTGVGAELITAGRVAKGDVYECARIAGLLAIKQTPNLLPHCHPIPILDAEVAFEMGDESLAITATVRTVAATGVEMEALSAVTQAALCVYDMLKPYVGDELEILAVRLDRKTGGKSQFGRAVEAASAAVIVLSDKVASGKKADTAGRSVAEAMEEAGFEVAYEVLPDDAEALRDRLDGHVADQGVDLVLTVGGTGVGPRDVTVETVQPLLTTALPGLMEAARSFGQARTPYAMLSRGVAGLVGTTVVATLPGSRRGAEESLAAVLPGLVHLIEVVRMAHPHQGGYE